MRDLERRFALPWSIYSLSSLPSSGCQSLKEESPNQRIEFYNYRTYSRGTRWLTAQSRSEVTVPMLRATRFAGSTCLPSVP